MRTTIRAIALVMTLVCLQSMAVGATKGRALSMRVLEKILKDHSSKQALTLCGITRLQGFLVDPAAKDIILVGNVDPSYPALHVDDLVVALRSANMMYTQRKGNVRYFTPPGCSIDPNPKVLQQLRQVGGEDPQAVNRQWEIVGSQPQKVRVLGVPFDTRFAQVMVDADYYMKRLSNGSVELGIPGFTSLMSLGANQSKEALASGVRPEGMGHSLNRFWFSPGDATYEEDDTLVRLRECQVKLLTEEEFLTSYTEVKGYGRPSKLARQFSDGFTAKYTQIAEAKPIYKELQALFRFVAIANLIRDTRAPSRSGNQFEYLLTRYKIQNVPVSRTLPGQTRIVGISVEKETDSGTEMHSMSLMSCGGVNMDVRARKVPARRPVIVKSVSKPPSADSATKTKSPTTSAVAQTKPPATNETPRTKSRVSAKPRPTLRKSVLTSRTSTSALAWDIPAMD